MKFDVIVVGGGHAGCEAAYCLAKLGYNIALITLNKESIASMPCNPSIGGPAKGIVTREIDALGGLQGIAADYSQLQMKILNTSKGPGVWALRAQCDKIEYHKFVLKTLMNFKNINIIEAEVSDLIIDNKNIKGVIINGEEKITSEFVILTTGTYLKSITFMGNVQKKQGPDNYKRSETLSDTLKTQGFKLIRLKTGTPPRIYKDTINYKVMELHPGSNAKLSFSHYNQHFIDIEKQLPCYILHTNSKTHEIIDDNLNMSAMYGGFINGIGPRYCPSIEDKVAKFHDKPWHQLFIEPESVHLDTMYLGGFSTSMPIDIQDKMIHSLIGLENCKISKYGYAIEYDAVDPTQLKVSLETKLINNLYTAGQLNGTSGYEEAAAQGLIAAINVNCKIKNLDIFILRRNEAYIGVMIDDIVTKGVTEPYRLLTSRAEHRLFLRNDNADDRLLSKGYKLGLICENQYNEYVQNRDLLLKIIDKLKSKTIGQVPELKNTTKKTNITLYDFLKRPEIKYKDIAKYLDLNTKLGENLIMKLEIIVKFEGYIRNQEINIARLKSAHNYSLECILNYKDVPNLSLEAIDKLNIIKPYDLDQATRISGINLTDIFNIKFFIDKYKKDLTKNN